MRRVLLLFTFFAFCLGIVAQPATDGNDVILKLNGDEMVGKVTEIADDNVKFIYKGETLSYTIKKADIFRITFASGRIEVLNPQPSAGKKGDDNSNAANIDAHNKAAVLPFGLIVDNQGGSPDMADKIQMECYNIMSKKAATIQFQDINTTNALLIKNNVTRETMKGYTMDEICHMLGVEYVVQGVVTLNRTSATTSTYDNSTYKKNNSSNSGYSTSSQNYSTNIVMNIFDEHGSKIFSKDHDSFWPSQDAYKSTLEYIAKRTPLYGK